MSNCNGECETFELVWGDFVKCVYCSRRYYAPQVADDLERQRVLSRSKVPAVGKLVAFQSSDGHVYTGIVQSEIGEKEFVVDVLGDGTYRYADDRKVNV